MHVQELQAHLGQAEKSADALTAALLGGVPEEAEAAARLLQESAAALSAGLAGVRLGDSAAAQRLRERIAAVARSIALQREACLRRGAAVERSLHALVPATRPGTYATSAVAAGPYGRSGRQSGAFKYLSA